MSDCLCVTLRRAAQRVTALYDEALAPIGVTVAQFSLLRHVQRMAPVSLSDLATSMGLDRSTVGRNTKLLERTKLLATIPGEDLRESTVVLTKRGARALAEGAPLWEQAQARIGAVLGEDGKRSLKRLMTAV